MTKRKTIIQIEKLETGMEGFDLISNGGLPKGRTTLVSGTSGSGKTILASQFLVRGIAAEENGVFVTFEESPSDIRRNVASFGWDLERLEEEGRWAFVDASPEPGEEVLVVGGYDFGGLLARVEHAISRIGAKRVVLDSLGAVFTSFADHTVIRREFFRIASALRQLGVTALMTCERTEEYGGVARYGVEEFVADNVVILRNVLEGEKRRRTIEILKFRGTEHQKGEWPFTVKPEEGLVIFPLSAIELTQRSSEVRVSSGNFELDQMCGGGFFRDSVLLVSGVTGTGKTLMVTEFLAGGVENGERCLFFGFEESREQLIRNARSWGVDFEKMERDGKLRILSTYPETAGIEDHLLRMQEAIEDFRPNRLAVDSLSALERVSTVRNFREFVIGITSFVKKHEIMGFFTATAPGLVGGSSITESHISTITDSIILLRYVEMLGEVRRGITVLKMRGSKHDKAIREFLIDDRGMHIGKAFRGVSGILTGHPRQITDARDERLGELFREE